MALLTRLLAAAALAAWHMVAVLTRARWVVRR